MNQPMQAVSAFKPRDNEVRNSRQLDQWKTEDKVMSIERSKSKKIKAPAARSRVQEYADEDYGEEKTSS
jgi:hypothetical protein